MFDKSHDLLLGARTDGEHRNHSGHAENHSQHGQEGAQFIVTGEVIGQRPMSQRRDSLDIIEKKADLRGYLLRPLSAQLLKPTIAENEGLVKRENLLSLQGRGRKEQISYAARFGLDFLPPAGGCFLTEESARKRVLDLKTQQSQFSFNDIQLLSIGRHFRVSSQFRFIIARNDLENNLIENLFLPGDYRFEITNGGGPIGLGRGIEENDDTIIICCRMLARYCKLRDDPQVGVKVIQAGQISVYYIKPATPADIDPCRI